MFFVTATQIIDNDPELLSAKPTIHSKVRFLAVAHGIDTDNDCAIVTEIPSLQSGSDRDKHLVLHNIHNIDTDDAYKLKTTLANGMIVLVAGYWIKRATVKVISIQSMPQPHLIYDPLVLETLKVKSEASIFYGELLSEE